MPLPLTSTCPQCRAGEPERFPLERHTVLVCTSCGYSWTAPPPHAPVGTRDPDHLAEARARLREALLRFLRPWVYPNSGVEASDTTPLGSEHDAAAEPHHNVA